MLITLQPMGKDGLSDEMAGMLSEFFFPDFPANDVSAENVEYKVEAVIQALNEPGKIRDVPGPDLIRCCGHKTVDSPFS